MNKLFTKIVGAALGLTMAIGVGVAVGAGNKNSVPVHATTSYSSVSSLSAGDVVVFAYEGTVSGKAVKKELTGVASSIGTATDYSTAGSPNATFLLTVETGNGGSGYSFKNGDNYLSWSSGNSLTTSTTKDNASSWTITGSAGSIKLRNVGTNSRYLMYNTGSPRWAAYGNTSQAGFIIYKQSVTYTVTYNANGGTCSTSSETVTNGAHPTLPVPTRANHTFDGWQINGAGDYLTSSYEVTSDITLVAHWTANGTVYTVTYDANGGSVATASEDVLENGHPSLPTPTKTHHTFDGWQINGSGDYLTSNYEVTSDITLVAHWTEDAKNTITYVAGDNASGSFEDSEYTGETYELLDFASLSGITYNSLVYRFKNYTVGGANKNPGFSFTLSEDVEVTVNFEVIPLEQTWDLSKKTYTTEEGLVTWSSSIATLSNTSNSPASGTSATNYLGGDANKRTSSRFYGNNIATLSAEDGYLITSAVFTATSSSYATTFAGSTWTNATASADDTTVTVTPTNGKQKTISITVGGTCGFTSVTVTVQKTWSKLLLDKFTCSGEGNGSITAANPSDVWDEIETSFTSGCGLSASEKEALKMLSANQSGTVDEQALARYDLVIRKYGTGTYTDFIGRFGEGGIYASARGIFGTITNTHDSATAIIIIVSITGIIAIGGYFFIRKRKEQ